jgi:hypothetical protein|tara:strand:- start:358 stop:588 length:231 start_codon:yes stop_codon:yes gene_type:complete
VRDCTKKCIELDVSCPVEDCRQWIDYEEDLNCTLLAVQKHGKMTFREVAKRLGVSFVRIKQIQDKSVASLAKNTLL